jgi:hypothetical protein
MVLDIPQAAARRPDRKTSRRPEIGGRNMTPGRVCGLISVVLGSAALPAAGQVGRVEGDAARYGPAARDLERRSTPIADEPLLLHPGHYVNPGEGPTYWSPHIRPFPDASHYRYDLRRGRYRHHSRFNRFGVGTNYSYTPFGCGGIGYGSWDFGDAESAYNQGRYDADHEYLWYLASQRAGRLMNQYAALFDEGMELFHTGHFDRAAVKFLGAAESNQSNAASRLHAGHALFALGRYDDAVRNLARAFELSPSLAYKTYDIRDEYGNTALFERQFAALRTFAETHPDDPAGFTLLGYVLFYSEGPGAAYPSLARAAGLNRDSYFIPRLLDLSRQTAGAAQPPTRARDSAGQKTFNGRVKSPPARRVPLKVVRG